MSDFFQLFAYGHRYLGGHGRMALVFPRTSRFRAPLPSFDYLNRLQLDVIPLDLETGQFGALPWRERPLDHGQGVSASSLRSASLAPV